MQSLEQLIINVILLLEPGYVSNDALERRRASNVALRANTISIFEYQSIFQCCRSAIWSELVTFCVFFPLCCCLFPPSICSSPIPPCRFPFDSPLNVLIQYNFPPSPLPLPSLLRDTSKSIMWHSAVCYLMYCTDYGLSTTCVLCCCTVCWSCVKVT